MRFLILFCFLLSLLNNAYSQAKKPALPVSGKVKIKTSKLVVPDNEKWVIKVGDNLKIDFDSVVFDNDYVVDCGIKNLSNPVPHVDGITVEYPFSDKKDEYKFLLVKLLPSTDKVFTHYMGAVSRVVPGSFKYDLLKEKKIKEVGSSTLIIYPKSSVYVNSCVKSLEMTRMPLLKREKDSLKVTHYSDSLNMVQLNGDLNSLRGTNYMNQEKLEVDNQKFYSEFELPFNHKIVPRVDMNVVQPLFQFFENMATRYPEKYRDIRYHFDLSKDFAVENKDSLDEIGMVELALYFDNNGKWIDFDFPQLIDSLAIFSSDKSRLMNQYSKMIYLNRSGFVISQNNQIPVKSLFYVYLTPVYASDKKEITVYKNEKLVISQDETGIEDYVGITNFLNTCAELQDLKQGKYKVSYLANNVDIVLDNPNSDIKNNKQKKRIVTYSYLENKKLY